MPNPDILIKYKLYLFIQNPIPKPNSHKLIKVSFASNQSNAKQLDFIFDLQGLTVSAVMQFSGRVLLQQRHR